MSDCKESFEECTKMEHYYYLSICKDSKFNGELNAVNYIGFTQHSRRDNIKSHSICFNEDCPITHLEIEFAGGNKKQYWVGLPNRGSDGLKIDLICDENIKIGFICKNGISYLLIKNEEAKHISWKLKILKPEFVKLTNINSGEVGILQTKDNVTIGDDEP